MLLACAALAMAWANSPWSDSYFALWEHRIGAGWLRIPVHYWINDALMVVFFLLVGLEIKREVLIGELSGAKLAALPVAAAAGGMLLPALIYLAFNAGHPGARGWGIPVATDIAFALGVLALLGSRIPAALKVFLTALAIADDIGAVLIIAMFYTATLQWAPMTVAAVMMAVLVTMNRAGARHLALYALAGAALWFAVLHSGVHATIAGVLLAATIPAASRDGDESTSPLVTLERRLQGVVAYGIMPLFAVANAGVKLSAESLNALDLRVVLGVALGLMLGKPIGIMAASLLAAKTRLADLPAEMTLARLHGLGWLGGIGFTMSLFVASLAFRDGALLDSAKVGVLAGSTLAGLTGWLLLRAQRSR